MLTLVLVNLHHLAEDLQIHATEEVALVELHHRLQMAEDPVRTAQECLQGSDALSTASA